MPFLKEKIEIGVEQAELSGQKTFRSFPKKIRWLIVMLAVAAAPSYFAASAWAERYFFSKYRQAGFAAKTSFVNPKAPNVSEVAVIGQGPGAYSAFLTISNQNFDLSLDNVAYKVNFYNAQKQQVYSHEDKMFLLPDQAKYIAVPRFSSPEPIAFARLDLPPNLPWQKRLSIPEVKFVINQPDIYRQSQPPAFVAEGTFVNNSAYTLKQVRLTFIVRDLGGKILNVSQRDENTLAAFGRRAYKQLWPELYGSNADKVEVLAETDVLDPGNLAAQQPAGGSSSDLSRPK